MILWVIDMAGERKGKTYEALLKVALDKLVAERFLSGKVFWNKTPDNISVEPDFIIGDDINSPKIIVMVTHSGSAKESNRKCWRNLGELCEIKTIIKPEPLAINIVFDAIMKESIKDLQQASFDSQLIVGDQPYGDALKRWVNLNESKLPSDQYDKASAIVMLMSKDKDLRKLLGLLNLDLKKSILKKQNDLSRLWIIDNNRHKSIPPKQKTTYVRRGVSKLLVFEEPEIAINLYRGKKCKITDIPDYAYTIGFAKRAIGRAIPSDEEISNAISLLDDNTIMRLLRSLDGNEIIGQTITQLRNVSNIEFMAQYVVKEYESLCTQPKLYLRLLDLHRNPLALVDSRFCPKAWPPNNVWLFELMLEVIKASTGKANGYGYAQLATDISDPLGPCKKRKEKDRLFLLSPWGYMSDWSTRNPRTNVPKGVIECVSDVLSCKIRNLGKEKTIKILSDIQDAIIHNLIEIKLCTYPSFIPLALLLQYSGVIKSTEDIITIRSCFAEKAGLSGASGKIQVIHVKNTLIMFKSCYGGHPADKKKELSGYAVGLRYSWDHHKKAFVNRAGVKKLILLIDGTWKQNHINDMIQAGWDEIYYPDEIDKLKAAIV